MTAKKPWLSVLVPVFNGAQHLRSTFESLLAQTERGFECVVIDGGSTDDSPRIIAEFKDRLSLRVFTRPDLPNWMTKTNFGLEVAEGEWVSMLHSDDVWSPSRAAKVRAAIATAPEVSLVVHQVRFIDVAGRELGRWTSPLPIDGRPIPSAVLLEHLLVQNFICVVAPTFKRSVARAAGGIDETLWYAGDWDFYLKLCAQGPALYLPEPLGGFRVHGSSLSASKSTDATALRRELDLVVDRHAGALPEAYRAEVLRVARASNEINAGLAGLFHGSLPPLSMLAALAGLGPSGLARYWRDSRIAERVIARLRSREVFRAR